MKKTYESTSNGGRLFRVAHILLSYVTFSPEDTSATKLTNTVEFGPQTRLCSAFPTTLLCSHLSVDHLRCRSLTAELPQGFLQIVNEAL